MTITQVNRYLLDTNLLVGFIRKADWALRARKEYNLVESNSSVFTSVICAGELLALAHKFGWGSNKREELEALLSRIPKAGINRTEILSAYAKIDAGTHNYSKCEFEGISSLRNAVPMKQNDIWIAATAHATKAILLSADKDFEHLNPTWLRFAYIDQQTNL